jgi:hypothetical protein
MDETPSAPPERRLARRAGLAWRPLLRAFHRDLGYVAVGLTLVYAASGLAVNHVADWDPNFQNVSAHRQLKTPLPADTAAATRAVLEQLGIRGQPREVYRASPDRLDITVEGHRLHVNPTTGRVLDEGQKPRFLLRFANWLHLNRGKRAWTLIADSYAIGLLTLAITGMFMLPGKKGLLGRGALLVTLGIAIPVLYVVLSGGPER